MTYYSIALLALLIHCIINYSALMNRHYRNTTPAGKTYRWLQLSVLVFYISDAVWGFLFDARLIPACFADTVIYFMAMTATVFVWTRYVTNYLQGRNRFITILHYTGWLFVIGVSIILVINFFVPVMFWFDESGDYHAGNLRYVILAAQILLFLLASVYLFITAGGKEPGTRRHHWAIAAFGIAMSLMVSLQVAFPLLPLYSIGCLLGTCILHTFVLEDLKEDRRLELEETLRREQAHQQELGSARHLAYTDSLTGVKSTHAYVESEEMIDQRIAKGELKDFGVIVFDVNNLKKVNDTQGHEAGDRLIRDACHMICRQFKHSPVYRIGGDEFVVMLEGQDYQNRKALLDEFERDVENNLKEGAVVVSSGLAIFRRGQDNSYRRLFERADHRMYDRKGALKAMET